MENLQTRDLIAYRLISKLWRDVSTSILLYQRDDIKLSFSFDHKEGKFYLDYDLGKILAHIIITDYLYNSDYL